MGNQYFDKTVDNAILRFQVSTDRDEREDLCRNYILPAFTKLSSYWYHRLSLRKNTETIHDCVGYLYEKIHMFNPDKGTRGFAYFNMVARHWFFQRLKSEKRENVKDLATMNLNDPTLISNQFLIDDSMIRDIEKREFFILFKQKLPEWKKKAPKEQERKVLDALINLFDDSENIDLFKKKNIFFYLKELTGMNSKQIALNLTKIKKRYSRFKDEYMRGDV